MKKSELRQLIREEIQISKLKAMIGLILNKEKIIIKNIKQHNDELWVTTDGLSKVVDKKQLINKIINILKGYAPGNFMTPSWIGNTIVIKGFDPYYDFEDNYNTKRIWHSSIPGDPNKFR